MLGGGIAIGHPGDVIADAARPACFAGVCLGGGLRPFGRHQIRGLEKPEKKIPDDQAGLIANADEALVPVHVFRQKTPDRRVGAQRRWRKLDQRRTLCPHLLDARGPRGFDPPTAFGDCILDKKCDQPAHELMDCSDRFEAGIKRGDLAANVPEKIGLANLGKIDEARA
jgi:hypothetical protein